MMVTESCSESRMRSRMSRGVPEWSGDEDLYIGSLVLVIGKVSDSSILYQECREGTGGPSGVVFGPKRLHGLWEDVDNPLVGSQSLSQGPKAPRRWKARVLEREGEESY